MAALFVYGTLCDPEVVEGLLRRRLRAEPARLHGYRRQSPPAAYPYIVAANGESVDGQVLHDLEAADLAILDRYEDEGRLYRRISVEVATADGMRAAFTYVGIPAAHPLECQS